MNAARSALSSASNETDPLRPEAASDRRPPDAACASLQHVAIQVRVFGPSVGVGKGMLMRKPGLGDRIQLTPSMLKVGPSKVGPSKVGPSHHAGAEAEAQEAQEGRAGVPADGQCEEGQTDGQCEEGQTDGQWMSLVVKQTFPSKVSKCYVHS